MRRSENWMYFPTLLLVVTAMSCVSAAESLHLESNGFVAVEAERFSKQSRDGVRRFYLTSADVIPAVAPDGDPTHYDNASGGAYLEILPDTRRTHADRLISGENFMPKAGKMAVLSYRVRFQTAGRYYVWVRAFSTGSEDNGLHVGVDGSWPESGQRLQWCEGKQGWRWESKQRTEKEHCGEPHKIYLDIAAPGDHVIEFSMREDGFEFDKWLMTKQRDFERPDDAGPASSLAASDAPAFSSSVEANTTGSAVSENANSKVASLVQPRRSDGDGTVTVSGEKMLWHNVTLTMDGPYAHEEDNQPNPFVDCQFDVTLEHASGAKYVVPGYFAADGAAANSAADSGTKWRAHFAPNQQGEWTYTTAFKRGGQPLDPFHGVKGKIQIAATDKTGRDFRAHGWLEYVGKPYLQFAGSQKYFLKAGADAPETLLGFADFDNTIAGKRGVPLKRFAKHVQDWRQGDPSWRDGKGKGLIGAINYLSGKGCNAFSFLTYNAGGDGDNVWPFVNRDDPLHYDCSKLDQWGVVFDHATQHGMYLHFKLQETENDDNRTKGKKEVPESLDGGKLGLERKLYFREMIARFGHNLALNWNLGEENTQSHEEQAASLAFIAGLDPYQRNRVLHTYPGQQDEIYGAFLADPMLTGLSLQNSHIRDTHYQTVKWAAKSKNAGTPWIVAFDESGSAAHGQCPDLGYQGFDGRDADGKMIYTEHEVRKQTLWGHLMGGGAGVEYYFGYKFVENDLKCEDWRSRDRSWDYCRIALDFFHNNAIPFWEMANQDALIGNLKHDNSAYCFAKANEVYLVYLPDVSKAGAPGSPKLNLSDAKGEFTVQWFKPSAGGELQAGSVSSVAGGSAVHFGQPLAESKPGEDWLAVVRKKS